VVAQGAAQVRRRIALRPQGAVQRKAVDQRVGLVGQGLRVLPGTQGLVVGEQQQGVPYRESGCVLGLVADGPQRWIAMGTNVERQLHLHLLAPVGVQRQQLLEDMDGAPLRPCSSGSSGTSRALTRSTTLCSAKPSSSSCVAK
jgi:hypothetical protein